MSFTRRQFLLTTSVTGLGFILPSFYEKALGFCENHGEPLILPAKNTDTILYAWQDGELELDLGHPSTEPPTLTRREYIDRYVNGGLEKYLKELPFLSENRKYDLDAEVDRDEVFDAWATVDSPWAKACDLIDEIDLGPDLEGEHAVGGIEDVNGGPCSIIQAKVAEDYVSLSLLQERLNQLNTGIRIELC
ncbi:MAG TPA: hypothetical protein EYQ21_04560 [Flavobacteriales bacterium]|jgi:hypothetical protein|nr:hypothetical protein [Flavobacteriales bacterium]